MTDLRGLARFAGAFGLAVAASALAARPVAADHAGQRQTFAEIVGQAKLIVVTRVTIGPDGGIILDVERVLKGTAVRRLAFAPTNTSALGRWNRAIVAFTDPATIDFRSPTIAWHVADDGTIDPEGFQQFPGLPPRLDAMFVAFGQDANDPPSTSVADSPATAELPPDENSRAALPAVIAGAAASGVVAFLVVRQRRRAQ